MVARLREHYGISDPRVLDAMRNVPRHFFVPEALQSRAYGDHALPISANQTISQPFIVARMTELLELDAILAVAALGACGWLMLTMGQGNASRPPVVGYSILGMLAAIATYDLSRHLWANAWRRHVREIDHGLKMTGAYFAMMSAGAGSLVREGQPWSQILPQAIGTLVMILFLVLHIRKARRT